MFNVDEINLIADKLGVGIQQVYQINIAYAHIEAIGNLVVICGTILAFLIYMYLMRNVLNNIKSQCNNGIAFEYVIPITVIVLIGMFISFVICGWILNQVLEEVVVPWLCPEYYAIHNMARIFNL